MPTSACALVLTLSLLTPTLQEKREHDDKALEPLAAGLSAYFEARAADEGVDEAEKRVAEAMAALAGKEPSGEFLRRSADLGRAVWLARGYEKKDVKKGKVTSETLKRGAFGGKGLEYAYRVPKDYDPRHKAYPLLLALPDAGEAPAEHLRTHWIHGELLERVVLLSPALPADAKDWEQVAVKGRPAGLTHVLTTLDLALETFALDFERIYVAGRGASVPAALEAGNFAPQRFAGVIGRAGDAKELAPDNFTNLPVLFLQAGEKADAFRHALKALGVDNCRMETADDEATAWGWMQEHPRTTRPESVTLVVGKPFPTRAYWLRVAPSSPNARATATLERATRTLRISTYGVSQVTLYLDDLLVDLQQPLRVLLDGVESTVTAERRLATALDLLNDGTCDPGCVAVSEVVLEAGAGAEGVATDAAEPDAEFAEHWKAAGDDAAGLWTLHDWCLSTQRAAEDARVLAKLVRLFPDDEKARAFRGEVGSAGLWFPTQTALERYQRSQQEPMAKARGLVLQGTQWIHRDERARALEGSRKDFVSGQWLTTGDQKRLSEGWVRQDLAWIPRADLANLDEGRWLVDGEWLDLATADRRHASIDSPWHLSSREVLLHSTAPRAVALRALEPMGRALEDLVKVFGAEPALPIEVFLLRDEEQYDRFAFGDPDGRRRATEGMRMHLVHSAYFAESWFARVRGKPAFRGMGVTFWDPLAPNGDAYGVHSARLAFGLSFVEALDPSPKAVKKALAAGAGPGEEYPQAYQAEKLLPAWLRWGGAVYAERFFRDDSVGEGGDPWWARTWSKDNLAQRGGLRPLAEVLALRIDPEDRDDGLRRLLEAGLLVSFVVDGGCAPVAAAHAELKRALAAGSLRKAQVEALTQALVANEAALRAY
jgi:hypothetical protein